MQEKASAAETTPLLIVASGIAPGVPVAPVKEQRTWRGHWAHFFGYGTPQDVAACCLAWHAPPVAFGWVQGRGAALETGLGRSSLAAALWHLYGTASSSDQCVQLPLPTHTVGTSIVHWAARGSRRHSSLRC